MRKPINVRYYEITGGVKYQLWQTAILKKIYDEFFMLNMGDKDYPVVTFKAKNSLNQEGISTKYDLLNTMEQYDTNKTLCRNFKQIVEGHMKYPGELAYMFHSAHINEQNELEWFSTKVADYDQVMFTSNILEYELYKYYRETRGEVPKLSGKELLEKLPLRYAIHSGRNQFNVLTDGRNRNAGISLQIFYTFIDKATNSYVVPVSKLPSNIASKQGRYQFMPEGGYRLRNRRIEDNERLFLNYKLEAASNRLLLEQLYGHQEIHSRDNLIVNPKENPVIDAIYRELANNKAIFEIAGYSMDLVTLRPTFTLLLRIDNPKFPFAEQLFSNNEEAKIQLLKLSEIPAFLKEHTMTNESIGTYSLLLKNEAFNKIIT